VRLGFRNLGGQKEVPERLNRPGRVNYLTTVKKLIRAFVGSPAKDAMGYPSSPLL
jgi:hypothetical protein